MRLIFLSFLIRVQENGGGNVLASIQKKDLLPIKGTARESVAQPPETVKVVGFFSVQVDSF